MAFYVVSHKVEDFSVWKKIYDAFEPTREQFGVKEHYALQSVDESNHVLVLGEGDLEAIKKYLDSEELKKGMGKAGVSGAPEIYIGKTIEPFASGSI